jgi:uncharacterized membrane protein
MLPGMVGTGAEQPGAEGDEQSGPAGEMDAGRVLALSDGVFAIASTLLVLDLRVPEGLDPSGLREQLHHLLPAVATYTLSYLLIGLLWLGHHRQFRTFGQISTRVARLNLLLLGLVSLLPFVTSLMARYGDQRLPVQLYAATVAAVFLLEVAMGRVSRRQGNIADRATMRRLGLRALAASAVFGLSIAVAAIPEPWAPTAAKYFWLLLIPSRLLVRVLAQRADRVRPV